VADLPRSHLVLCCRHWRHQGAQPGFHNPSSQLHELSH
jgi:hypothetical protein